MPRTTALLLVLALTAASASRLACIWECEDGASDAHAATPCHEVPADRETLASTSHCPLTPGRAALWTAKGNEAQRLRPTFDEARTPDPAAGPTFTALFHPPGPPLPLHVPGAAFQSRLALRV